MGKSLEDIKLELKKHLIEALSLDDMTPEQIEDSAPLFGAEGLGLDSLDAVEIVVIMQRKFGVDVKGLENRKEIFQCIDTLSRYIAEHSK